MQPQAAPAMNVCDQQVEIASEFRADHRQGAEQAGRANHDQATATPDDRLAGNIAMLKPIQNTGISHCRSAGLAKRK